ncbi:serine/threonine-protein kinase ATM [Drosophila eugracilis]|uniref:serine/threonine-protein kinase ATM n=1 Tax=Drosophila eugracilis TaxID=29029 RepID=UPI001BDAAA10|nr:serine/threonine-protein kinase ATM [Drosophila eugracilis]XP_041674602.1 serine/threonine-protein kinase ATM [Drosophila eugracilis]
MSGLLNDIQRIIGDLQSGKPACRNKAIEQLDEKLSHCREDLNCLFLSKRCDLSWTAAFESVKEALFKHSGSLEDANEKSIKTLAGKNYLFDNVLEKITQFNLEAGMHASGNGHFLAKSTIFNAFEEGIKMRVVVKFFGDRILSLLDRGIYSSDSYVRDLKINEYSRILSYLFELNVERDEVLSTKILKCITKTVTLAKERVQLHGDLVEYLPELSNFARSAHGARKTEIVRLYLIFASELSVNCHYQLSIHAQEILPKLCEFHDEDVFRDDTRNLFFQCITMSLQSLYPKLNMCDFNTFGVPVDKKWSQTLLRLKTIVNVEIRKNLLARYKTAQLSNYKFSEAFIKMSALVMYIVLWHLETKKNDENEEGDAPKKVPKPADKMDIIFNLINKKENTFNDVWFAIFAEILQLSSVILNVANYQQALTTVTEIMQIYGNARNLQNLGLCIKSLLAKEQELLQTKSIREDFLSELWIQMANHLILETTTNSEEIREKQLVLQMLIRYNKLNQKMASTLLHNITSNEMLKRNECISTVREIFVHADKCGLDKTSADLEPIISWAYGNGDRNSAAQLIHNIGSIDARLQADTFAISIINFLDEQQLQEISRPKPAVVSTDQNLLAYKYNKQLICLDKGYSAPFLSKAQLPSETKNCLIQTNYECLMRGLNFQISEENNPAAILKNLNSLLRLTCTMERLLYYKVFDAENNSSCPLIKRIGLYLSHIEFQFKANSSEMVDESDLREILRLEISLLDVFKTNVILLNYLERQPIEMLMEFVGAALKMHCMQRERSENDDHTSITAQCLNILAGLCACSTHRDDAFEHITKVTMIWHPQDVLIVTKMLCSCQTISDASSTWLVSKLKTLFQHHYQDLDVIDKVVEHMPTIFHFVCRVEYHLEDMLMALNSLLRIALKKSYTSHLTAKIVRCVGLIAQQCPDIYLLENFTVICKSTAKFITMPTLEVRFATLFTFTILLNTNCVTSDAIGHSQAHWDFCKELYDSIEFKKLTYNNEDATQNSNALVVQMLIAFFVRSSFHQEIVLKQLLHHCALHRLTETEFVALQNIVPCYGQTVCDLIQPFAGVLLHHWSSQRWPLSKFPYFLCYGRKSEFRKAHANNIMAYTFLYGKTEDIEKCSKSISEEVALPIVASFLLPKNCFCSESEGKDFKDHQQLLSENLSYSQLNATDVDLNVDTLCSVISFLHDPQELQRLFGSFAPCCRASSWYSLTGVSLFDCLNFYIDPKKKLSGDSRVYSMITLQVKHSRILVDLFAHLKANCFTASFSSQALRNFFLYCEIADAVYDAAKQNETSVIQCSYFVRDIWFFVVRFLQHTKSSRVQMCALTFLELLLNKPSFASHDFLSHLGEIAKLLSSFQLGCELKEAKEKASAIVIQILELSKGQMNLNSFLEETTDCEFLKPLREEFKANLPNINKEDVANYLRSFLTSPTAERLRDLREYIAEHKDKLQENENLLFDVINKLIQMTRDSNNKRSSSLDALKCLAQIGPLKFSKISYYFQTDFESFEKSDEEPMEVFLSVICQTLEKSLFHFDPKTHESIVSVAVQVVNSKPGTNILGRFKNLQIFANKSTKSAFLNSYKQIPSIDWLSTLKATQSLNYESWMCAFLSKVFQLCGWQGFDDLAAKSFAFAKTCLQPFIRLLLENHEHHVESLCQMLDYFFKGFASSMSVSQDIYHNKRAIKRFLHICESIRIVNNWSIPVNLSNVIMASNHCQAYFLSIMYLELWASDQLNILDNESFQACAKKAYESIGCLDAIPGFVNPMRSRLDFLGQSSNLSTVLLESDHLDSTSSQLCVELMKGNGLWSFAKLQQHQNTEPDYEIFWRLGEWDSLTDPKYRQIQASVKTSFNLEQEFKRHHFLALRSIGQREEENSLSAIDMAYNCVRDILMENSVECLQSVYKYLTWLCSLQQSEDFCQIQFGSQVDHGQLTRLFGKWQTELNLNYGNFSCKEYVIAHQIALFKMAGTKAGRRMQEFYQTNPITTYLLKGIEECKSAGKFNLAAKYIATLRELPNIREFTKISVLLEDAEVNLKMGNQQIAKAILEYVTYNNEFRCCTQRVPAFRMQGEFLLDCNAETLSWVQTNKFNISLKLIDDFLLNRQMLSEKYRDIFEWHQLDAFANKHRTAAYAAMAKYADREYQQLYDYRHSQEYLTLQDIIEQNRQAAEGVTQRENQDRRIISVQMKRYASLDERHLKHIEEKMTEHLCLGLRNHMAFCRLDNGFSSAAIYRIISLWFTNAANEQLQKTIKEEILTVPSYKFICAANQLTARLNSKNMALLKGLVDLLVHCGSDHPHQTFYQLYPLVFAHLDGEDSNTERSGIARKIIAKICAKNSKASECSKQLESLLPALITFANEGKTHNNQPVSDSVRQKQFEKVRRWRNLNAVHCPTLELPVMPSKEYNITSIVKWNNEITQCGGLNAPVKILCVCSDGQTRAQLVKGKDDLRQDAVMQQVFGIVNELLNQDSEFIERKLKLRTYKVTPLSMRSGILEWCTNSTPVGQYLVAEGKGGAHARYRPNDWNNQKCRKLSSDHLKMSKDKRYAIYKKICENIKPVFHYFLLEKFPIPGVWFERRLAYTNSVATTSMVGYVLGLGDRHTQNILIDQQTAEVIHIDFGIAFEQGKIQTTPETVPFRLTRDFVAPMGICGTKGVFAKSCEATMHILRRYKSVFTTILEVLLYDPLFIWGVLKNKQSPQQSNEESVNLVAQRALLLVQNKLEGREAGTLGDSNVEAQVERLINEATLPSNLCMLFPGWDPQL